MNTVATRARALALLALAAFLSALGLAAVLLSPTHPFLAWAATPDEAGATHERHSAHPVPRPTCAQLSASPLASQFFESPVRADWHSVALHVAARGHASGRIGHARAYARAATPTRREVLWRADAGASALIVHSAHLSQIHTFAHPQFQGRASLNIPNQPAEPIDSLTLCYRFALTLNRDINTEEAAPSRRPADALASPGFPPPPARQRVARTWRAHGTIIIDNLTPLEAALGAIRERTQDGITAEIDCGVPLPGHILKPGASLRCRYTLALPSADTRQSTLTVQTLNPRVAGASAHTTIDFRNLSR